jgi:BASS family bile acid:Na+ symporter
MSEKLIQIKTFLSTRGKGLLLLIAMLIGVFVPQAYRYSFLIQSLLMVMLFFAFLDIDLKPRPSQKGVFCILLANVSIAFAAYALLARLDLQLALAAFLTAIAPTAISAAVIVSFVKGDMEYILASILLTNIIIAFIIPFTLPSLTGTAMQISPLNVFRSTALVMFLPLLLAQLVKKLPSGSQKILRQGKSFSLPLWLFTLFIVSAKASDFLRNENAASLATIGTIALVSLIICMTNFGIGVLLGGRSHWRESGQALGHKNLTFVIWVALTFVNPLVAMGPIFYIIYHHIYNSWLIYQFEKTNTIIVEA